MNDNLTVSLICSNNNNERYTTYFQAGICIFSDDKKNNIVIDVFSKKYYNVSDPKLSCSKLHDILIPCFCGLTLPDRRLVKIMGSRDLGTFLKQREIYYDSWRSREFSHPDFPI